MQDRIRNLFASLAFYNKQSALRIMSQTDVNSGPLVHTIDDFIALRNNLAETPQGGAALFIHALLNWSDPNYKSIGEQMLVLSLWEDNLIAGNTYKNYGLFRADTERVNRLLPPNGDYVTRSYVSGTTPANGYSFDPGCIVVRFRPQDKMVGSIEQGQYKVFIWSSGADTARPVTLKRNSKGYWKVFEYSSLTVGIRAPQGGHDAADDL